MRDGGLKHVVVLKQHLDSLLIHNTYVELTKQLQFKRTVVSSVQEMLTSCSYLQPVHALWIDISILLELQQDTNKSLKEIIEGIMFAVKCHTGVMPHVGVQFQNPEHVLQIKQICEHKGVIALMTHKDFFEGNQRIQCYQALLAGHCYVGMYVHHLLANGNQASDPFPFKIVGVSPGSPSLIAESVWEKLKVYENVQAIRLTSLQELCSSLLNEPDLPECICVDADVLVNVPDSNLIDVVNMIVNLCNLSKSKSYKRNNPLIYVNVKPDTDIDLIRQILRVPQVNGLGVTTDFSLHEIQACVKDIKEGVYHIPEKIKNRLDLHKCKTHVAELSADSVTVTVREQQIMDIICSKGYSNKMIANHLKITESAVKLHIGNILKKHRVKNRTELAIKVAQSQNVPVLNIKFDYDR